jgi:uncharacterized protein
MSTDFTKKLSGVIRKYRWPIIILNMLILLAVVFAMGERVKEFEEYHNYMLHIQKNPLDEKPDMKAPRPIFDADYRVWFDENNEQLIAYDELQKTFAKEENLIIVIKAKNNEIFTEENLKSIKELTELSWTVPYVNRVDGLSNFIYTYVEDDDLLVEPFLDQVPTSKEAIQAKKELALNDPIITKYLLSKKSDMTQIQLIVNIPKNFSEGYGDVKAAVVQHIENALKKNSNLEIKIGGTVVLNNAFLEFAVKDIKEQMPFMFIFIVLVLLFSLRSITATISPLILLVTSVIFPIALFVGVFNFSMTNATTNTVQILLAVAIADSVHILAVFYKYLRIGMNKFDAITETLDKTFIPCMLTSVTTAIGFYSMLLIDMPPFQDLGLFAGTGALYAFYSSAFTLPAVLSLLPFKKREVNKEAFDIVENKGYEKFVNFIDQHQKAIRIFTLVTAIVSIYLIFQINVDNNPVNYFDEESEFRQATEYIDQNIIGVNLVEFSFDSGEDNGIYDPDFMKKLEDFQKYIEAHPEFDITYVSALPDIVKRINKTMNGDKDEFYTIPQKEHKLGSGEIVDGKKLIAQYMLLYQMSLPQGMELTNQIDINNRYTRVVAFMKTGSSWRHVENFEKIEKWINETMPETGAKVVGVPAMFGYLMKMAIPSVLLSLLTSFFFITLSIMVTFKSFRIGLYSMIPNMWPMVIIFGTLGLLQTEVNLSVAIVGMITLGIVVDDSIHFLSKYFTGRRKGYNQHESVLYALRQVGQALIYTSLILVAGFGAMIMSDFAVNSDMAKYCTSIIALALFADFILLPAVLFKFDTKSHVKADFKKIKTATTV